MLATGGDPAIGLNLFHKDRNEICNKNPPFWIQGRNEICIWSIKWHLLGNAVRESVGKFCIEENNIHLSEKYKNTNLEG